MKSINNYISEKLVINRNTKSKYNYFPETRKELQDIIKQRIEEEGNNCNLNDIDVSEITDMWQLFYNSKFNGDISEWNVSNVEDMESMFENSKFNQDISNWNVSKVKNMREMFRESKFNKDISNWDVRNVINMTCMFDDTPLEDKQKEWWSSIWEKIK